MVTGVPNITNVPGYEVNQFVLDIRFQILRCSSWGLKLVDPAGPVSRFARVSGLRV